MGHVNQPVFHLRNHPRQNCVHGKWALEVEFAEFPSEGAQIEGRRDWAAHDPDATVKSMSYTDFQHGRIRVNPSPILDPAIDPNE